MIPKQVIDELYKRQVQDLLLYLWDQLDENEKKEIVLDMAEKVIRKEGGRLLDE